MWMMIANVSVVVHLVSEAGLLSGDLLHGYNIFP